MSLMQSSIKYEVKEVLNGEYLDDPDRMRDLVVDAFYGVLEGFELVLKTQEEQLNYAKALEDVTHQMIQEMKSAIKVAKQNAKDLKGR